MRIWVPILLLVLHSVIGFAQDFSNKGKDFWIAYPAHVDGNSSAMGIYITSDVDATGTITVGTIVLPFTLTANSVVRKFIGPNANGDAPNTAVYLSNQDGITTGAGIHVVSDKAVAVYAHIIRSARSGATLVLPTNVWGKNYVAPSFQNLGSQAGYGELAIMAKLPNTTVEITPRVNSRNGARVAGTPYQITLPNPGDVYQVQFSSGLDISGTTINSVANAGGGCNPIAVISATTWTGLNCAGSSGGDNLYQQLFPTATWGKTFLTSPYIDRPYDIVRVFVTDPTTIVTKTENGVVTTLTGLSAGNFYEYTTSNPTQVDANKAISVVQYIVSQNCKAGCTTNSNVSSCWSDPEMIILNPVEQTINNITLFSAHRNWVPSNQSQVQRCLLNVIIKTIATTSFTINGIPPSGIFKVIPGTAYSFLQEDVTFLSITNPVQTIRADSAFSAIAYGYGSVESYGYNAGTNVKDLYQQIAVVSQYGIDPSPSSCLDLPIKFKISLPYQPDSLYWDFKGNSNQSPAANVWQVPIPAQAPNPLPADSSTIVNGKIIYWYSLPSDYTYNTAGVYPVNVSAYKSFSDGCGNIQDIAFDLEVFTPPVANFYWQHNGCLTQAVQFRDTTNSSKPPYQWIWDFGDPASGANNTSTLKNTTHQFSAAGTYTVSYYIITTTGCISNTITRQITVTQLPDAKFGVPNMVCDGTPVLFSDTSVANGPATLSKWYWDYGDGIKDTVFTNSNRLHGYNSWGNKTASLKVETNSGCQSAFFTKDFTIHPNPVADFILPPGICLPADSARFLDASTVADGSQASFSYEWTFGNPLSGVNNNSGLKNPVHYYTTPGPFTIQLKTTTAAGCMHDTTKVLSTVYPRAIAGVTVNAENCLNSNTSFTSTSNGSGNTITSWYWDYGDGTPMGTTPNPVHLYAAPGPKIIRHWVTTDKGCTSDTATRSVAVLPLPMADFIAAGPLCVNRNITFTDASLANAGNLTNWNWDLGDGTLLNATNGNSFTHSYATTATFTVSLTVITDKGCVSTPLSRQVVITPLPVPDFTHTPVCLPAGISNFSNRSVISNSTALAYNWNFGDPASGSGNLSVLTDPSHFFSTVGPYSVSLEATSVAGCTVSITKTVSDIYPEPVAAFTVSPENCLNTVTGFSDLSSGAGNTITQWHWDFGDGTASALKNPTHTYLSAGTKTVTLWTRTDKNCPSDTASHTVVINPLPTGNFNYSTPTCETNLINFTDAAVPNAGVLVGWQWNFNDPASGADNLSSANNPVHNFASAGTYQVSLFVTTNKGCISQPISKPVIVNPQPQAGFIVPKVCLSDTYAQFQDTSSISTGTISNWLWNFGDPSSGVLNTSTQQHPQHSYTAVGAYTVSLRVTSSSGCTSTVSHDFFVNGSNPAANFTVANPAALCANDSVAITNTSTVFPGTISKLEIYWDNAGSPALFETDDLPAAGKVYKHLYTNFQNPLTRNFTIRLKAYSGGVCVNDRLQVITVNAAPKVQFTAMPNTCLDAAPFQITQATETGGVPGTYRYTGPGVSPSGLFSPLIAGWGTHTILYTYTATAGGCTDTASRTITVLAPPLADFITSAPACETSPVTFSATATTPVGTITAYSWNFGDGTPVVVKNSAVPFAHTFAGWGSYTVTLQVTTSNGCTSTSKQLILPVKPQPIPNFSIPVSVCLPAASVTFNNLSVIADGTQNAFTYAWDFGDPASGNSNRSVAKNPSHIYSGTGPYPVTLKVTSGNGCIADTTILLNTIHPQPRAAFSSNLPNVCIRDAVSFTDLSNGLDGTVTNWNWSFGDGQMDFTRNPVHLYGSSNTFNVSLFITNSVGCNSDTITKPFTVYPYPVVNAGPDRVVLEGGSITLQPVVTGNDLKYLWTPGLYLTSVTIATPQVVNPVSDITYILSVTARGNCTASDNVFVKVLLAPRIPNTFTPNGDGINERWLIKYLDSYPDCRIQVFTRTGQLVYETKGYSDATAWNGTLNGKSLPMDTYYYILEPGSGRKPITGYVTIIK